MFNLFRRICAWGISSEMPPDLAERLRLTNGLLVFLFFGSMVQTAICLISGARESALLNATGPIVFGIGLLLMKSGRTVLARVFVFIVASIGGYALVASMGPESHFQFMILFASGLTVAIFTTDLRVFPVGMLGSLLTVMALEVTKFRPIFGMVHTDFSDSQIATMHVASLTLVWALLAFHFFYFIRARLKYQEQLVSAAKLSAVGRMAAAVAHEVNNPLQLIVSHAEKIKSLAKQPDASRESIEEAALRIQSVAMRIASINRGLLAISRNSKNDPFLPVSVHAFVEHSVDFCRAHLESHKISLQIDKIEDDLFVVGNETQLSEVLLNLLNNALDAVVENSERWIRISVTAQPNSVDIAVTDSGLGVDAKINHRIFEPFFTTKSVGKGVGLGLSVSQSIIESHHGKIACEPVPKGARFVIHLPRSHEQEQTAERAVTSAREKI